MFMMSMLSVVKTKGIIMLAEHTPSMGALSRSKESYST
jgi:hypothetical protein